MSGARAGERSGTSAASPVDIEPVPSLTPRGSSAELDFIHAQTSRRHTPRLDQSSSSESPQMTREVGDSTFTRPEGKLDDTNGPSRMLRSARFARCAQGGLTNTALLAVRVPAQGVLATETRRQRALLERVHDRVGVTEELLEHDPSACMSAGVTHVRSWDRGGWLKGRKGRGVVDKGGERDGVGAEDGVDLEAMLTWASSGQFSRRHRDIERPKRRWRCRGADAGPRGQPARHHNSDSNAVPDTLSCAHLWSVPLSSTTQLPLRLGPSALRLVVHSPRTISVKKKSCAALSIAEGPLA